MPPPFIRALLDPAAYPHAVAEVRVIETHISWVLVAGAFAYKIKKPVNLGFLDFSTLSKRRHYCQEELRLNRRLAPEIYLDVVAITGTPEHPRLDGPGPAFEYAVKMRAFPAEATLDRAETVSAEAIDAIALRIACFHASLTEPPPDPALGSPEAILSPALANFQALRERLPEASRPRLATLEDWTRREGARLAPTFAQRRAQGYVRECHGDLHLGNIAWVDGAPLIFDGIEFDPALRWIDVQNEIAFLFMDLASRGLDALAWRLLNRYLEHTGDYPGLEVFRFYLVYRALVRAKVAAIRAEQAGESPTAALAYLDLAKRLARPSQPALFLMHGPSGSGKTWLSQRVLERLGCVRLRSDVERKRLYGLSALEKSASGLGTELYGPEASARTFAHLAKLAAGLLDAGLRVIVDATFLDAAVRAPFRALAAKRRVPLRILSLAATPEVLRARIEQRQAAGGDASEATLAVLQRQLERMQPLLPEETGALRVFDLAQSASWAAQIDALLDAPPM